MGDNDRYMKMMKEGYQLQHPENEYLDLLKYILKMEIKRRPHRYWYVKCFWLPNAI